MAVVQIILLSIPLLIRFLFILKWTGDCYIGGIPNLCLR